MPTIRDVAKACNVSTATVSYVINGKNTLLPETRERVLRKIREMNYHPSAVARGLSNKRMNTFGILFDNVGSEIAIWHPYTSGILQGVVAASAEVGCNVTIFTELWRNAEISLPKLRDQRTDGIIIVAPPSDTDILPSLLSAGSKVVTISSESVSFGMPSVDVDNAFGIKLAVRHLREMGHREIAFIGGQINMFSGAMRLSAFQAALDSWSLSLLPEHLVLSSYEDSSASYSDAKRLLSLPNPPAAVVAGNDQIAFSVLAAARDLGIAIPAQLSVIGFDDIADAATTQHALTTIKQPLREIGAAATRLLAQVISGDCPPAECLLVEPTLVVRATTGSPR